MNIGDLLLLTKNQNASDLHINVGVPPTIRIHGTITKTSYPPLTRELSKELIYSILSDKQRASFEETRDIDFAIEVEGIARFRVNVYLERRGIAAVFRTINVVIPSIEDLGLPATVLDLARREKGIILVTGPTGSGKSTTLAAMLDVINTERKGHILTLEDPIEYVHNHKNCVVSQREIGPHSRTYASALRAALREDPDFILVGEMRDLESIQLAIRAAETGHLVLSTLHTMNAPKTIDRIIDVFPPDQQAQVRTQISESLEGVISQTLIPRVDGQGRVAAIEIMTGVPAIRNLIREAKLEQIPSTMQVSSKDGMQTMDQSLVMLVQRGLIGQEVALQKCADRKTMIKMLGLGIGE
ncbi:MAG: type IV pilus twitching motility protein PilT [bacterium]